MTVPMITDENLAALLRETGLLTAEELSAAERRAKERNEPLSRSVLWYGFLADDELGRLMADMLGIPFVDLSSLVIPEETLLLLPEVVARKQRVVVFSGDIDSFSIAVTDPGNREIIDFLERKTGKTGKVFLAAERDIDRKLAAYGKDISLSLDVLIGALSGVSSTSDSRIIELVDAIIRAAHENQASDIHIEPEENRSIIRFRIDGFLQEIADMPKDVHVQVVSRVKVLAKLRMDEHAVPQDGKLQAESEAGAFDVRVSIVPVVGGEKAVLRLLSERSRQFSLETLGLSDGDLEKIRSAYAKPYGCVLSTGPTGCGKTTTLYAVLKLLNRREVNIMTIEDPVEYDMEGVNQIQVNQKSGLTFATGLRSILRQDPNVVLVGEIRDGETAEIAIQLAMTGHLVLSTLHTNNAATTIPRLLDMGIEPFLVASTVNVIIAQRLIRRIHEACRVSEELSRSDLGKFFDAESLERLLPDGEDSLRMYRGKGCPACHGTGFDGRVGIFEVLVIDDNVREAILARKDAATIQDIAVRGGMRTLIDDGFGKIRSGATTLDEVLRATRE